LKIFEANAGDQVVEAPWLAGDLDAVQGTEEDDQSLGLWQRGAQAFLMGYTPQNNFFIWRLLFFEKSALFALSERWLVATTAW
jgi:hypothetical protein